MNDSFRIYVIFITSMMTLVLVIAGNMGRGDYKDICIQNQLYIGSTYHLALKLDDTGLPIYCEGK